MINKKKITEYIEKEGLTLQDLSDKVGISNVTLSRVMNDHCKPSLDTAQSIAKIIGVSTDELFSSEDSEEEE